jgi:WD40 repeat protein
MTLVCLGLTLADGRHALGQEAKELATLKGHTNEVQSIAITPDGKTLVAGGNDKLIKIWDLATRKERATLKGHRGMVDVVALSRDGKMIASGGRDRTIKLWDLTTYVEQATLEGHTARVRSLAFSPDGKLLASGSSDETIKLWDLATRKEQATIRGDMGWVFSLAFSPDGKILAAPGRDGMAKLWDVASRKERARLFQSNDVIVSVVFSPDGKMLATGGSYRGIRLWEVATGMQRASFVGSAPRIRSLAIASDGKALAAGGWQDGQPAMLELWDLTTGRKRAALKGDADSITSVAFTPDGNTLAAAEGPDTAIRLWDVRGLQHVGRRSVVILSDKELESSWNELAGADAAKAYRAIWALAAAPRQAVPWLAARLQPAAPPDAKRLARLIADLDSDEFAVREQAAGALKGLGESAGPALRRLLAGRPSAEVRRRVQQLLEDLEQPANFPERLRVLRAIEVLEHAGTAEAQRTLERLAAGMPEARVTEEAKQSLDRLVKRGVAPERD